MPSKQLKAVWAVLNIALLAASAILIAFSILWRTEDHLPRSFVISKMDLDAGLVLGIAFMVTWMISIAGIIQPNHVTLGLVMTNWALIADAVGVVVIGCTIWFYTLTPTDNFLRAWEAASPSTKQALQDTLSCCGYSNTTTGVVVNAGFCANATIAAAQPGCSTEILPYAAYTLQNIFTSIFGLMAVVIGFFLATVCVVNRRQQSERFRRIDEKRGGRGFV